MIPLRDRIITELGVICEALNKALNKEGPFDVRVIRKSLAFESYPGYLASRLELPEASVQAEIQAMIKDGLVVVALARDERGFFDLELTEAGADRLLEILKAKAEAESAHVKEGKARLKEDLARLWEKLMRNPGIFVRVLKGLTQEERARLLEEVMRTNPVRLEELLKELRPEEDGEGWKRGESP